MAQLTDKLITFAYMKGEVDIPQNVESPELDHKIYKAQERLRMLMGDEFYQDFLTNKKNNTLSSAYQALFDPYIKQFIAWNAFVFWTIEANYKPTRSGYRVHSEDNSIAVPVEEMAILIKDRKQSAEYYTKLLVSYMDNHYLDLPLYDNKCRNLSGNSFHITAVKKSHGHDCHCRKCRV
jgi:hypothetical protein